MRIVLQLHLALEINKKLREEPINLPQRPPRLLPRQNIHSRHLHPNLKQVLKLRLPPATHNNNNPLNPLQPLLQKPDNPLPTNPKINLLQRDAAPVSYTHLTLPTIYSV